MFTLLKKKEKKICRVKMEYINLTGCEIFNPIFCIIVTLEFTFQRIT